MRLAVSRCVIAGFQRHRSLISDRDKLSGHRPGSTVDTCGGAAALGLSLILSLEWHCSDTQSLEVT